MSYRGEGERETVLDRDLEIEWRGALTLEDLLQKKFKKKKESQIEN